MSFADQVLQRDVASIAGVQIDSANFETVTEAVLNQAAIGTTMAYVVTPNAHHVMLLQRDRRLREIYEQAFLVVPDGVPLLWAAKLLGERLNGRVNGTDLFLRLCAEAATRNLRVFLLGGREGAAIAAAQALRLRHNTLQICGTYCPPFGFEADQVECERIVDTINAAAPHLLFVGLGAPKQEYWMYEHRNVVRAPMALGIGVSFEFVGGIVRRAPAWMQHAGLEWFFRLVTEPQRMWKRYLIGNLTFCGLVLRQYLGKKRIR